MRTLDLVVAVVVAIVWAGVDARADEAFQPGQRVAANDYYDAYYDGQEGPFADGYWGTDGHFWFEGGTASDIWERDDEGHFRRTPAPGFKLVHGTGMQREN
jgi:hypothetical protein